MIQKVILRLKMFNFFAKQKNWRAQNYVNAGCYVSWFQKKEEGEKEKYSLTTDQVISIFSQPHHPYFIFWVVDSALNNPILYSSARFYTQKCFYPNPEAFEDIVKYTFGLDQLDWADSTLSRRCQNTMAWLHQIIELIGNGCRFQLQT